MQISSVIIASLDRPSMKMELWEDCNSKATPYYHPYHSPLTFDDILKKDSIALGSDNIEIHLLKSLIIEIRNYNASWRNMVDTGVTAAPVDVNHPLYTHLAGVDSLLDLFPEDEIIR